MNATPLSRHAIIQAVQAALEPLEPVFAGWEGGSAAFDALDQWSDIDLTFLVDPQASTDALFEEVARGLARLSPIAACYHEPPGPWEGITHRFYRLAGTDDYLLIDLAMLRADARDRFLDVERHGHVRPLFDKADWLQPRPIGAASIRARADKRRQELETWFPMSQNFVVKAILRDQPAEAVPRYMAYTLRPLVELLRMRDCPLRWDFGLRYLDRDLAPADYARVRELVFVRDLEDLRRKHAEAAAWGLSLLHGAPVGGLAEPPGPANRRE